MDNHLHLRFPQAGSKDAFIRFVYRDVPALFCHHLIELVHFARLEARCWERELLTNRLRICSNERELAA